MNLSPPWRSNMLGLFCLVSILHISVVDSTEAQVDPGSLREAMDPVSRMALQPTWDRAGSPEDVGLSAQEFSFPNLFGQTLRGWFFDREGTDRVVIVFMGNTGNISYMLLHARILFEGGYDVFLFDYQGFGRSDGVASVLSLMGDSLCAYDYVTKEFGRRSDQIGVLGISLGSILALATASQRQPAAVAVEDVFVPRDFVAQSREFLPGNVLVDFVLDGLQDWVLPSLDPTDTAPRIEAPLLLIHGETDWLLPPWATPKVAATRPKGQTRVYLIEGVGHSPESLVGNDREYAYQLNAFFDEVFATGELKGPALEIDVHQEDERFRTTIRVTVPEAQPVKVALANSEAMHFERRDLPKGETEWTAYTEFRPQHGSVVRIDHTRPSLEEGWKPDLSFLSTSLANYKEFETELRAILAESMIRDPQDLNQVNPWAWVRQNLPPATAVHPAIRPRYAYRLAWLCALRGDPTELLAWIGLQAFIEHFPEEPTRYFELGNAQIGLGFDRSIILWVLNRLKHIHHQSGRQKEAQQLKDLLERCQAPLPTFLPPDQSR